MKINFDNNYAQLTPESDFERSFIQQLRADTAILAPGALFVHAHKLYKKTKGKAGWDGKVYSIDNHGYFLTGLLPRVMDQASKKKINVSEFNYIGPPRNVPKALLVLPKAVQLRDYQKAGVDAMLNNKFNGWWPRGILQVATGGGKTEMAVAMYWRLPMPTLFVVHLKSLLHQTVERFKKYGITTGVIGDGVVAPNPSITVATVQSLNYQSDNAAISKYLQTINQVFFDEAHGIAASVAKGNVLVELSKKMPNAFVRWGLTATPFMRDVYSNNLLEGVTGPVIYKIGSDELIKAGHLTPPDIRMIKTPPVAGCAKSWPGAYDDGIVLNSIRTAALVDAVKKAPKPAIVMCNQIAHATMVERKMAQSGLKTTYLDGSFSSADRSFAIRDLVLGKYDVLICTTIFNAGIDIPQLRTVALASGGKSKVALLQKLGRGLRRATAKNKVTIIDFYDASAKVLERHSKERRKVWTDEGFTVTEERYGF